MKVAICTPVHGDTKADFTSSLVGLVLGSPGLTIQYLSGSSSRLPWMRGQLAQAALDREADWLLWLDSDQTFPADTLNRLLAHDLDIIGCNVARRIGDGTSTMKGGKMLAPGRGVEVVDGLGLGVCLVRASVFRAVAKPWFEWIDGGEDYYFFRKAAQAGFLPYVDHDLSLEVGHIASLTKFLPRPE